MYRSSADEIMESMAEALGLPKVEAITREDITKEALGRFPMSLAEFKVLIERALKSGKFCEEVENLEKSVRRVPDEDIARAILNQAKSQAGCR